ncbi:MAG: clan AA aspartic protease [Alphaproteobacteria bacterium]|nr:clan AA aspartic protease [Alphaproteobacteria bacterium]
MRRNDPLAIPALLLGLAAGVMAWAAVLGLGVTRRGEPVVVALTATVLVFGPALAVGAAAAWEKRLSKMGGMMLAWSAFVFLLLPVYFPGERRDAVATGLAILLGSHEDDGMARSVADVLPDEPEIAVAQVPQARPVEVAPLPPAQPLDDHAIALPYEGEGRRLSVPVVFEHDGRTLETFMMLDTGATYTTLPSEVLARLGIFPSDRDPELTLNTANGPRTARVVLLDTVWLGDLYLDGVAITTCEDCASDDNAGLLGLNVTGGYNMTIDADRREVVFTARRSFNRRLDVRPFADLQARFQRYPGGRVEVEVDLDNRSARPVHQAAARVTCGEAEWMVDLGAIAPRQLTQVRRRLPRHDRCPSYQIALEEAVW